MRKLTQKQLRRFAERPCRWAPGTIQKLFWLHVRAVFWLPNDDPIVSIIPEVSRGNALRDLKKTEFYLEPEVTHYVYREGDHEPDG